MFGLLNLISITLLIVLSISPQVSAASFAYVSIASENRVSIFDLNEETGALRWKRNIAVTADPGVMRIDAKRNRLYLAYRNAGKIASFDINPETGFFTPINTIDAAPDPCYLEFDRTGKWLLSAYYVAGKVAVHEIKDDGSVDEKGKWYATDEKAHAIIPDQNNRWTFVPHTGPNSIYVFEFNSKKGTLTPQSPPKVPTPMNTGPRHFAIHPQLNVAYCNNEQGSSLTQFIFDRKQGILHAQQTISTLPKDFSKPNSCARLEMHPNGRFIYSANRGHDSIAAFVIDSESGKLTSIGQFSTPLTPRSFDIVASGEFLIAAGENADQLAIYRIEVNGGLTRLATHLTGKQPWWVQTVKFE